MKYDVYLVGVGGQGLLTIAEILAEAACRSGIPVNSYPSKGMAQRGGFVRAQLRFGRELAGPSIADRSADLVIAAELSEALKAVCFIKPGGAFVLSGEEWKPTAVILGKAPYPTAEQVKEKVVAAGARLLYLGIGDFPVYEGRPTPENLFLLGAAMGFSALGSIFDPLQIENIISDKWVKYKQINLFAYNSGRSVQPSAQ